MANWNGHVAGGVVLGAAYAYGASYVPIERFAEAAGLLDDWKAMAAVLVISVLFALFPDVDTNSKGQDIFFGIALAFDVLLIATGSIQAAAYLGLIAMLPVIGKHRGWTHSKLAMLLVPSVIVIIPYLYSAESLYISLVYYGAAVTGYFSHLLLDGLVLKWIRFKT